MFKSTTMRFHIRAKSEHSTSNQPILLS